LKRKTWNMMENVHRIDFQFSELQKVDYWWSSFFPLE